MNRHDDNWLMRQDEDYQGGMRPADWENEPGFERGPGPLVRNRLGGVFGQGSSGRWEGGEYGREGGYGPAAMQPGMGYRAVSGWGAPSGGSFARPAWESEDRQRRAAYRNQQASPWQAAPAPMSSGQDFRLQRGAWTPGNDAERGAMEMGAGLNRDAGGGRYRGYGPRGYQRADSRIHEDVCEALTRHGWVDASDIEVSVQGGEVTLRGTVDDRQQKRLAEEAAEACTGVRDVHNQMRVRGRQGGGAVPAILEEGKAEDVRPARAAGRGTARAH